MQWKTMDDAVARAMRAVPREIFLPENQRRNAGVDTALPIGFGQTISQPSLVAYMTGLLQITARTRVLEIGTGSGFQAAILAELAGDVFTIERLPALAVAAETRLRGLAYDNIHFRVGDGARGWPEAAPFDAIIVTAAAAELPPALLAQLAAPGRLVAPVADHEHGDQVLVLVEKNADGGLTYKRLLSVRFVPLVTGDTT